MTESKITQLYVQPTHPDEGVGIYTVGKGGIIAITEHRAQGEGDKWYYDIQFEDGTVNREFCPVTVIWKPQVQPEETTK